MLPAKEIDMSERREKRRIEKSAGTGSMSQGGAPLGTVSYLLEIWQTIHIVTPGFGTGPTEEVEGLKEIRIRLVHHALDSFKLTHEGATLTLQLEGGRLIDGFLDGDAFIASGQLRAA